MLLKEKIKQALSKYLQEKEWAISGWSVDIPKDRSHGDYSANIAFLLSKLLRQSPHKIADEIAEEIQQSFQKNKIRGIEVSSLRGFINFSVQVELCYEYLSDKSFSRNLIESEDRILLEFVSANPTGPLHIGHGRWAALGDSLARILKHIGYNVSTEYYINDAGNQIENLLKSVKAVKNNEALPEDGYAGDYVKDLVDSADPVADIRASQEETLKEFRVVFDTWYSEKESLRDTKEVDKIIKRITKDGLTFKQDKALFFRTTDFGDDKDRVLIKDNGVYTYFAADIAYHYLKYKRGFNNLINIWGADHHGYIKRVEAGLMAVAGDKAELEVLLGQLVTLYRDGKEVRMSKRTGEMITLREVFQEIGIDAARFYLVMKSADIHLDFDMDLAKKQSNDNPVFYVQYAHARISSILRKSEYKPKFHHKEALKDQEIKLIKYMLSFEDELLLSAQKREPHRIANYLLELANLFHSFYHVCKVNVPEKQTAENRLAIINKVKDIIAIGLDLLGVSAPDSM